MDERRACMLPLIRVVEAAMLCLGVLGCDPLLVTSIVVALEVAAAVELVALDEARAHVAAGTHIALALLLLARLLLVDDALPAWSPLAMGAVLFAQMLAYVLLVRRWLGALAVLLPLIAIFLGVSPCTSAWAPVVVALLCAGVFARWPVRATALRSELPGVRLAAVALVPTTVLDATLAYLPVGDAFRWLYLAAVLSGALVAAGFAVAASGLSRTALAGVVALVAAFAAEVHTTAVILSLSSRVRYIHPHADSALAASHVIVLDSIGHILLGAALVVRASKIPGAPVTRLRRLLGGYGLVSGIRIVASYKQNALLQSDVDWHRLEAIGVVLNTTLLLGASLFIAFVVSYRRAALQRGLPLARQLG